MLTRQILNKSNKFINLTKQQSNKLNIVVVVGNSTRGFSVSNNNETIINDRQVKSKSTLINNTFKVSSYSSFVRNYSSTAGKNEPIKFNLADVGEGIAECEVIIWYVKEGDSIKEFDKLCEVQSDKATVEITSRYDGIVTKICHKIGDMAKVGEPLVEITPEGNGVASTTATGETPKLQAGPASSTTGTVTTLPLDEEVTNEQQQHNHHHEYDITNKRGQTFRVLATPSIRHLAKVNSINLNKIQGTGKDGRVLKENILDYLNGNNASKVSSIPIKTTTTVKPPPSTPVATPSTTPSITLSSERETRVPITGIKKVMVKSMNAASAVPHFGFAEEYIMDKLTELRNQMKPMAESRGIKLSYMPFLIKATSLALTRYPVLNSSISQTETEIIYKNYHNIGVAMDTPQGLLVPNIKNVESKSIFEIAQELNRLQKAGIAGQLTPNDMSGGTFSLSNIGTIGGTYCSPVLLLPEVCIGAIGKIQKLPRFDKQGNVAPVSIMNISWSGDHRVIDGATIANFSNALKNYIESPNTMLFDTR